ncbi:MAG: elongation factor Ts [Clostridiales bacterium]|nr:elongation factor Ts [Clostridiales bacterium]
MISASTVKELREITGAGMMDCKKALTETNGDIEKAIEYLREKGISKAAKKSSRVAAEGVVAAFVSEDAKTGAVVEVNAETDFVSKNEEFVAFVNKLVEIVAVKAPKDVEELKTMEFENGKTVEEVLTEKIATIGENMSIRRFERIETDNLVGKYIHGNGQIAVLVELKGGNQEVAKDVCMQVAALNAEFLDESQIPADRVEKEKEIITQQTINEGKPANIAEKIAEGRLKKYFEELCLVHQKFVKDSSKTVSEYVKENGGEIVKFYRLEKGEGIEKKEDNFVEEVMSQLKNN